jgi:hydroxyacyl-ACP dehydratase HTD2-like protein with hotdog domain
VVTGSLADRVAGWHPPPVLSTDLVSAGPVAALSSALGYAAPAAGDGDPLPPLWHWLSFLDWPAPADLGPDGHPSGGPLLPPVPDRRRMWAGGRLTVHDPLLVGLEAQRSIAVSAVRPVTGRTGELVFVTTRAEVRQRGRLCVVDEVDVVYRSGEPATRTHPRPTREPAPQAPGSPFARSWCPDPVLLFRFSALTGNSHRIHYDDPYCREVEGYPSVVVHGPLLALLMVEAVRRPAGVQADEPAVDVSGVDYRLLAPVFVDEPFLVDGEVRESDAGTVDLSVRTSRHGPHATARVRRA